MWRGRIAIDVASVLYNVGRQSRHHTLSWFLRNYFKVFYDPKPVSSKQSQPRIGKAQTQSQAWEKKLSNCLQNLLENSTNGKVLFSASRDTEGAGGHHSS